MVYQIPSDLLQRIEAQINSGTFASQDEVLREAMDALERRQRGLHELRQMVQEAESDVAAGRVGSFDAEATKRIVRQRLLQQGITE